MTSKALNAAMNIQRRIRSLSLQPSERERQKFVKNSTHVANATAFTVWGSCCSSSPIQRCRYFQANSVIPGAVLINLGSGFARDCFGLQALVISVNGGTRYRSPRALGAVGVCASLVWPDSRGGNAAGQNQSSIQPGLEANSPETAPKTHGNGPWNSMPTTPAATINRGSGIFFVQVRMMNVTTAISTVGRSISERRARM